MKKRRCPALFISAPASGQGKTTVTAGLAFYHRKNGRSVRVFKIGPDFLDPKILERASGNKVHNIDLWMVGETESRRLLFDAAQTADLILIEGVMGLFDGRPSSADLAELFQIPVVAVIDAAGMAQTFHAVAQGLASYRPNLHFLGAIANGVASERHQSLLEDSSSLPAPLIGCMYRDEKMQFPNRHLGLVQAEEIADIDNRLERAAESVHGSSLTSTLPEVEFSPEEVVDMPQLLSGMRIAVAQDQAFSFIYESNLSTLASLGAEIEFFSPLADQEFHAADSVYLPGGYPELFLDQLADSTKTKAALANHIESGKSIYAECGGMLYLLQELTDKNGKSRTMTGLIPGRARMEKRLQALGLQSISFPAGELRGHTFHYSKLIDGTKPARFAQKHLGKETGEAFFEIGKIRATYLHLYFPSNPVAAAALFI